MEDDIAVRISNVSKTFKLPHEKHSSVKSMIISGFRGQRTFEKQKVLKDISFEINKGEFFGIVGRNGSGKSTLLKLIAGIYSPDSGGIAVNGKLVPFIELGVGFNPELTGRENVYLNSALLGFSREEVNKKYKQIVEFAELEKFMDQKLKNYSSGMQVRLAFSIAIQAKGDILLLDEVLAVGDEAFQRKCFEVFDNLKRSGKTIILVTHSMSTVEQYCTKALLLNQGGIAAIGDPIKIASMYSAININEQKNEEDIEGIAFLEKHGVKYEIINKRTGKSSRNFNSSDSVEIRLKWRSSDIKNVGIALLKQSGEYIYGPNTISDNIKISDGSITYRLKLDVQKGSYKFMIAFFGKTKYDRLYLLDRNLGVNVESKNNEWSGLVKLKSEWI